MREKLTRLEVGQEDEDELGGLSENGRIHSEVEDSYVCVEGNDLVPSGDKGNGYEVKLNWFQRHLNWTFILATPTSYVFYFVTVFAGGLFWVLIDPNVSEEDLDAFGRIMWIGMLIIFLLICGWILGQKGRSLRWLLILFVPFGWVAFLLLENKNYPHNDFV